MSHGKTKQSPAGVKEGPRAMRRCLRSRAKEAAMRGCVRAIESERLVPQLSRESNVKLSRAKKYHARPRNADLVILGPPLGGYMYKVDFVNGPWRGDAAAGCKLDGGAGKICHPSNNPSENFVRCSGVQCSVGRRSIRQGGAQLIIVAKQPSSK